MGDARVIAIALAIGILLGFEREHHQWREHGDVQPAGTRTIAVISVTGAVAALISSSVIAGGAIGVAIVLAASYVRTPDAVGATTAITCLAAFFLGALTATDARLAVAVAAALTVLLESKPRTQRLVREVVSVEELQDATRWFVLAFVVLPLLPSRGYGPEGVIEPSRIWELVVLLTGIGWVGYIATRAAGERRGLLIVGAIGGFISGAATTTALARLAAREPARMRAALGGALLASVSTCAQLAILATAAAPEFGQRMIVPMGAGALTLATTALLLTRHGQSTQTSGVEPTLSDVPLLRRPLALRGSLLAAAVLTTTLVGSTLLVDRYGAGAASFTAAATGLADVHAATLSIASLVRDEAIGDITGVRLIGLALVTNTITKVVGAMTGGLRFGLRFIVLIAPAALVIAATLMLLAPA